MANIIVLDKIRPVATRYQLARLTLSVLLPSSTKISSIGSAKMPENQPQEISLPKGPQAPIDLVSLAKTLPDLSTDFYVRLQGAGAQVGTLMTAAQLTTHFRRPDQGRKYIIEAIDRHCTYTKITQILYFGFDKRNLFTKLTVTISGIELIALCAMSMYLINIIMMLCSVRI